MIRRRRPQPAIWGHRRGDYTPGHGLGDRFRAAARAAAEMGRAFASIEAIVNTSTAELTRLRDAFKDATR